MTTLAEVTALIKAHVNREEDRFRAITLQIAAHLEAKSPQGANQLRSLVANKAAPYIPYIRPLPEAQGLLCMLEGSVTLEDMVLAPTVRELLDRILLEQRDQNLLQFHNLYPARKLLFSGPPGTGKTMAAKALSHALGLSLFRVELHSLIKSHLGETAANVAKVFDHVRAMRAVYLFDEFDALGTDRAAISDGSAAGNEIRRTVNTLLQLIEDDRSSSLLIAATNHPRALDSALFRRFDEIVPFPSLTKVELTTLIDRELRGFTPEPLDYEAIHTVNPSLGHSDLCSVLNRLCKDHVLLETPITTERLIEGIRHRLPTESLS